MNILHHKSWHVYSAKNQEKVRKDEEEAAALEEEKAKLTFKKDSKSRLEKLRNKANEKYNKQILYQQEEVEEEEIKEIEEKIDIKKKSKPVREDLDFNNKERDYLKRENDFVLDIQNQQAEQLFTSVKKEKPKENSKETINKSKLEDQNYLVRKDNNASAWYLKDKNKLKEDSVVSRNKLQASSALKFNDPLNYISKKLNKKKENSNKESKRFYSIKHSNEEEDTDTRKQRLRKERELREKKEREREVKLLGKNNEHSYSKYHPEIYKRKRY